MSTLYYAESDLAAMVPPDFLLQALDDNNDGVEDVGLWASLAGQAGDAIDAYLGLRYALPLGAPYPAIVINAARVFTCELLYKRRGVNDEANPWAAQAGQTRTLLKSISMGQSPLSPELNRQDPSASVVTQPMRSAPRHGSRLSC
jgi:phage gp36-like protein